jgi:hypothetical protein
MHALTRQNPDQIKRELGRLVPWVVPFYLVTLAAVNGLLSFEWATPTEAAASFHAYSIIPLYDYYIVTKPQAAKNIIAHIVMYAPVGIMIWLRAKQEGSRTAAFFLAAALSAMVEAGRFLRPGLVPDINAIPLAGAAAWAALATMPLLWRTLSAVSIGGVVPVPLQSRPGTAGTRTLVTPARDPSPVSWRDRDIARRSRRRSPKNSASGEPIGEIEDY